LEDDLRGEWDFPLAQMICILRKLMIPFSFRIIAIAKSLPETVVKSQVSILQGLMTKIEMAVELRSNTNLASKWQIITPDGQSRTR
jgi:hypothetical protein